MFDRLLEPACLDQCIAQVVVGLGIIGFQPQGLLVMFDCLLQAGLISVNAMPRLLWASA